MTVVKETHLLRITFDLSILLISAGICRVVSHDSNAPKTAQIRLWMAEKWLKNQTMSASGSLLQAVCNCSCGSGQIRVCTVATDRVAQARRVLCYRIRYPALCRWVCGWNKKFREKLCQLLQAAGGDEFSSMFFLWQNYLVNVFACVICSSLCLLAIEGQ